MASLDLSSPLDAPQPLGQLLERGHSDICRVNSKSWGYGVPSRPPVLAWLIATCASPLDPSSNPVRFVAGLPSNEEGGEAQGKPGCVVTLDVRGGLDWNLSSTGRF